MEGLPAGIRGPSCTLPVWAVASEPMMCVVGR